jgi:hypothetical protein
LSNVHYNAHKLLRIWLILTVILEVITVLFWGYTSTLETILKVMVSIPALLLARIIIGIRIWLTISIRVINFIGGSLNVVRVIIYLTDAILVAGVVVEVIGKWLVRGRVWSAIASLLFRIAIIGIVGSFGFFLR